MDTIKLEVVYKDQGKKSKPKFDHFKATIGNVVYDPIPISFIRISELPVLEEMFQKAYELGGL